MLPAVQESKVNTTAYCQTGTGTPVGVRGIGGDMQPNGLTDVNLRANVHAVVLLLYIFDTKY